MISRQITIINRLGLHARAAAKLVGTASRFASSIQIGRDGKTADAKSIMAVMMLAASKGSVLTLQVAGDDQELAAQAVEALILDRFGEEE